MSAAALPTPPFFERLVAGRVDYCPGKLLSNVACLGVSGFAARRSAICRAAASPRQNMRGVRHHPPPAVQFGPDPAVSACLLPPFPWRGAIDKPELFFP